MNAVSLLVTPKAPASPGLTKAQGSREEQAAFSPALMMLLAAGLAPTPVTPTLAVTPEADLAANDSDAQTALEGGDAALDANTGSGSGSELNLASPALDNGPATAGAAQIKDFKVVAPTLVATPDASTGIADSKFPAPSTAAQANQTSAAQAAQAATAQAAAAALAAEQAASFGADVHVESRDIASRNTPAVAVLAQASNAAGTKAGVAAAVKAAAALAASQLATIDPSTQPQAAPATIAAAILTSRQPAPPSAATGLAQGDPAPENTGNAYELNSGAEQPASGEAVLDSARRAAAVANHPAQQLKRSIATLKQAEVTTPEPVAVGSRGKAGAARQATVDGVAAVQQASAAIPGATVAPREATPPLVSSEGFTARSTQQVPQDPRLDSVDGGRNALSRPDQVTLRIDGESGEAARLRVAVRGREVRASIATDDPSLARRLEEGLGSLRNALGDRGFDKSQVLVQGAAVRAGDAPQEQQREPAPKQRQQNPDSNPKQGKQSETPEQRNRSRNGRNTEER